MLNYCYNTKVYANLRLSMIHQAAHAQHLFPPTTAKQTLQFVLIDDFEQCCTNLVTAEVNLDGKISQNEFLSFAQSSVNGLAQQAVDKLTPKSISPTSSSAPTKSTNEITHCINRGSTPIFVIFQKHRTPNMMLHNPSLRCK